MHHNLLSPPDPVALQGRSPPVPGPNPARAHTESNPNPQVRSFILRKCASHPPETVLLSFIGHSLGSVIIRAAVLCPSLVSLKPRLHAYVSLSGPHMGYDFGASTIVSAGRGWSPGRRWGFVSAEAATLRSCLKPPSVVAVSSPWP